jgi:hypothetical protein
MASISTGFLSRGALAPREGLPRGDFIYRPPFNSVLSFERRRRSKDAALGVGLQVITMGDPHRDGIHADQHIYPILVIPQQPHVHSPQGGGLAQGAEYRSCDCLPLPRLVGFIGARYNRRRLLFPGHCDPQLERPGPRQAIPWGMFVPGPQHTASAEVIVEVIPG